MERHDVLVRRHSEIGCQEVIPFKMPINHGKQRIKAWREAGALATYLAINCIEQC